MTMRWHHLLFAHWPIEPQILGRHIPKPLVLDTFDGQAWLAVVPFVMSDVRLRWLPPMPGTRSFPELNLRTYTRCGGRSGVYFFSLDAQSRLAVRAARTAFHLPYFDAEMNVDVDEGGAVSFTSERVHPGAPAARLHARYRPTGPATPSTPGSLEHFLTERYCLFTADRKGRARRADIEHRPWPLQPAECSFDLCEMTEILNLPMPSGEPLLHYAEDLEVHAWRSRRVR